MTAAGRDRQIVTSIVALGAAAGVLEWAVPGAVVLRTLLGLPFLLIGQGYLVSRAVFPGDALAPSVRLLVSLAFSIAAIIIVALALAVIGVAITPAALTVALVVAAAAAGAAGSRRPPTPAPVEPGVSPERDGGPDRDRRVARRPGPGTVRWLAGLAVAAAIVAGALFALARPLPNSTVAGYTRLWALRDRAGAITVGVASAQHATVSYRVLASAPGGGRAAFTVRLAPGESVTRRLTVPGLPLQIVHVDLYPAAAAGAPRAAGPYRSVLLAP
ncbi:MAG: DUF1616 domain-containing protein [Solirubrobacteraceae bacterium]|jgi:uncharacterized membrane protein